MKRIIIFTIVFAVSINFLIAQTEISEQKPEFAESKSALTGVSTLVDSFDIFVPKEKYTIREGDGARLFISSDNDSLQGDFSLRLDYILEPYSSAGTYVAAEWQIYPSFDFSKASVGSLWVKGDGSDNSFAIGFLDTDDEIWIVKSRRVLSSVAWNEFKFGLNDFQLSFLGNIGNKKFDTSGIKSILYIVERSDDITRQGSIKLDNFTFGNANFPAEVIERRPTSLIQSGYVDIEYRKIDSYFDYYAAEFKKGDLLWNLLYLNIVYKTDKILGVGILRLGALDFGFSNERYGIANSFQSDFTVMLYLNRMLNFINFVKIGRLGPYFNDYIMSEEYEIGQGEDLANRSRTGHFFMGVQGQGKAFAFLNYDLFYIKHWHDSFTIAAKSWFDYDIIRLTGAIVDYEGKALYKRDENNFQSRLAIQDIAWTSQIDIFLDEMVEQGMLKLSCIYGENQYKRYSKIYEQPYNEYEDITAADEITNDSYFRESYDFSDIGFTRDRDLNYLYEGIDAPKKSNGSMYRVEIHFDNVFYLGLDIKGLYEKFTPYFIPMFRNKEILRERPNILFFNQREMYGGTFSLKIWKLVLSGLYKSMKSTLDETSEYYYKNGVNIGATVKYRIFGQTFIGASEEILGLEFPNSTYKDYNENRFNTFLKFMLLKDLAINGEYVYLQIVNKNSAEKTTKNITYYAATVRYNITNDAFLQLDYTELNPIDAETYYYGARGPDMYEPKDLIKVLIHIDFRL